MRTQPNRPASYSKSHITRHGKGWKYARAVPLDLRPLEGNKTSWVKYLGRIDYGAAVKAGRELDGKYDVRIAALRKLAPAERAQIFAAGPREKGLSPVDIWVRDLKRDAQFESWDSAVEKLLNEVPLDPDPELLDEENARQILELVHLRKEAKANREHLTRRKKIAAKFSGEPVYRLTALVALWVEKKEPRSSKTVEKAHLYVRRFVDACGDLEPHRVTRAHAVQFLESLKREKKMKHGTINLHLEKMHALFNVALGNNMFGVQLNPFTKVRETKPNNLSDDGKLPFTAQHVRRIFSKCPPGSEFEIITHLLAYHGGRSSEISQLTANDIGESHGVLVLRIHPGNGGLKGSHSKREVPVHPACRDALLAQCALVKAASPTKLNTAPDGNPWLFPESVCLRADAVRGHDFQLKFGCWLRDIGITNKSLSLHCFRHTFRDLCREVEMPEDISRAIMGHSLGRGDHGATYGKGASLKKRLEWLSKIDPTAG